MKPLKQKLIPAVLALMVALPVGAYAAQSQDQPDKTAQTDKQQTRTREAWKWNDGKQGDFKHRHEKMQEFKVHYENYMLLLAEKYTPAQLNEWKAVFAQRKALLEQCKNKAADHRNETAAEFRSKAQDIKKKVEKGEITRDEAKKQFQALKKQFAEQRKEKQSQMREKAKFLPEKSEERNMLRKQFTEAVKNNDEAGIKAVLPKLLQEQKEMNEHISTMLKQTSKQS